MSNKIYFDNVIDVLHTIFSLQDRILNFKTFCYKNGIMYERLSLDVTNIFSLHSIIILVLYKCGNLPMKITNNSTIYKYIFIEGIESAKIDNPLS